MMKSATASGEPAFVLPDGRSLPRDTWPGAEAQNKPARDLASTGRVGLIGTSLGQDSTAEMTQVAPITGGDAKQSARPVGEGGKGDGASSSSLGGQARTARPALGECERWDCREPATQAKTLYCKYQGQYCDEHARTEW